MVKGIMNASFMAWSGALQMLPSWDGQGHYECFLHEMAWGVMNASPEGGNGIERYECFH